MRNENSVFMQCGNCKKEVANGSMFCNHCGVKMELIKNICPNKACGRTGLPQEAKFCPDCGIQLKTSLNNSNEFTGNSGTFIDERDGHEYKWVRIGSQIWMAENLQATTYNDGEHIPNVKDGDNWKALETGAYCNYDNDKYNAKKYGCLYNWYAVDSEKLAPQGWHVPSKGEWNELEEFLRENGYGNKTDGEIGKSLASKTGWPEVNEEGTVGNNQKTNNSSGFTALPCSSRNHNGKYVNIGGDCDWWSSTDSKTNAAWSNNLVCNYSSLCSGDLLKVYGFSVRCVRD